MNNPFARSLSLRMLTIMAALTIIALIAIVSGFSRGLGSQWRATIGPHLTLYARYVQDDLGYPPERQKAIELAARLPLDIHVYKDARRVFSTSGQVLPLDELAFDRRRARRHPAPGLSFDVAQNDDRGNTVIRTRQRDYTVYFELQRREGRGRREGHHLVYTLLILLGVMAVGFWLIRRQLAPIGALQRGVARMRDGELDHRIRLRGRDDLAILGQRVDAMAERIEAMLDAKRQLLLALSHELRTPLARARVAIELLPDTANTDRLRDDLHEMQALIDAIIETERLQQHAVLQLGEFDLAELLIEVVAATDEPVVLQGVDHRCALVGDRTRLGILFRNLVGNALLHGRPDAGTAASVRIELVAHADEVRVCISDTGPGIAASHLGSLGEPFYRTDESRTRDTGGFGLGLTLSRLIAEAHGGSLEIDSDPSRQPGTRVRVCLPRQADGIDAARSS